MPLNIVYIDDESGLCEMFEDNFTSKDICVKTFLDPEKALLAIANDPPDLVFLDFRLPGTTGDVVVTKIDRSIPVAMISGDLNVKPNELFVKKLLGLEKSWVAGTQGFCKGTHE